MGQTSGKFWSDKRVVVTGGAGFLGSHVVDRLRAAGAKRVFSPRSEDYDLVHERDVQRLFNDHPADLVIHLAAHVGGIGANQKSPATFLYDTLMMGALTLEYARRSEVKKTVVVGTVCAYPKLAPAPFREESLWDGYPEETNAPYGLAKRLLLVQAQAYRKQYGMDSIYLIPVNLYGPRDNFDLETSHVIPAMIRKCLEAAEAGAKEVKLWGTGRPTREFLYVEDAAEGILLAAERYDGREPVNLGTGVEISIRDLAAAVGRATGFKGRFVWDSDRPDGQPRRVLDVSRAKKEFGFSAGVPFDEGLRRTVEWYRSSRAAVPSR